jgi:hypothetical protein
MMIPGGHFTLTGIGRATAQYWMQWNERARRARKRFLEQDDVEIVEVTKQEFVAAFSATRVKHAFRSDYIRYFTKMCDIDQSTVRSFLAISKKSGPLAGLAVHDSHNMSTHLVAFTSRDAKASQC